MRGENLEETNLWKETVEEWMRYFGQVKIIYLAGPIDASSDIQVRENIAVAHHYAIEVWKLGMVALCPHKNDEGIYRVVPNKPLFYAGGLELVARSDGVFMLPNWQKSFGSRMERQYALKLGKPVFYALSELKKWVENSEVSRMRGSAYQA